MAAIESSGFAPWVQPAHFRFVSIARTIPLRVAHPPPELCAIETVPIRVGTRLHPRRVSRRATLAAELAATPLKGVLSCRRPICTKRFFW